MIELQNVSKEFISGKQTVHAVKNVNLTIDDGKIFGIIGYSGAGKSTVLRMLNFLEQPTKGEVIIDGQHLSSLSKKELLAQRKNIGMIFQHFNLLWSRTVVENVMLPLEISNIPKEQRLAKAQELIQLVGLEGKEHSYPSQLSGGQKQRVGIARALATNSHILLADEATSALDPETTSSILRLLKDINHQLGVTIVLITHQMEVIKEICHEVAVMDSGKVVEFGTTLDIFTQPQHETTKKFVQQIDQTEDVEALIQTTKSNNHQAIFYELTFLEDSTNEPILNMLVTEANISFSILHGAITQTADGTFGQLIIQISGSKTELLAAQKILDKNKIKWRKI